MALGAAEPAAPSQRFVNADVPAGLKWFPRGCPATDHMISSQRGLGLDVVSSRSTNEADMPFLFWMPMIVMCGLWRAAEEDAKTFFPNQ
jgi:hypothetical protein